MIAALISANLIITAKRRNQVMNSQRTNGTHKIGDLISSALLQALGPNVTNNYAAPRQKNTFKTKVEEGDPVRSAERVPYSSSHQLSPLQHSVPSSLSSDRDDNYRKDADSNVAAA